MINTLRIKKFINNHSSIYGTFIFAVIFFLLKKHIAQLRTKSLLYIVPTSYFSCNSEQSFKHGISPLLYRLASNIKHDLNLFIYLLPQTMMEGSNSLKGFLASITFHYH